jgi:hypothetical protein
MGSKFAIRDGLASPGGASPYVKRKKSKPRRLQPIPVRGLDGNEARFVLYRQFH